MDTARTDDGQSPLDVMAKAAYEEWIDPVRYAHERWEGLPEDHRLRLIGSMEAALLALAGADLPDFDKAVLTEDGTGCAIPRNTANAAQCFRSMLRAIAQPESAKP